MTAIAEWMEYEAAAMQSPSAHGTQPGAVVIPVFGL